uniref:Uncharacterized protein n=1 Tax=Lotharella oceanica TaxID=641309 RepID=A0A7S2U3F4_9EUKA|eukprot:CAMPEP_0170188950 /NCGR_PEP_ID=MMETSP0040_2-20121228/45619_1 /TAXON_ID=641309 /ORGANISM="Lotharella oceanica, Strain CCMP622" /LENGTH=270 /DNA_ID=CAMNT_0010436381 /DNA_START=1 /DNA_END=813 /DNA_ORIENTATION=+
MSATSVLHRLYFNLDSEDDSFLQLYGIRDESLSGRLLDRDLEECVPEFRGTLDLPVPKRISESAVTYNPARKSNESKRPGKHDRRAADLREIATEFEDIAGSGDAQPPLKLRDSLERLGHLSRTEWTNELKNGVLSGFQPIDICRLVWWTKGTALADAVLSELPSICAHELSGKSSGKMSKKKKKTVETETKSSVMEEAETVGSDFWRLPDDIRTLLWTALGNSSTSSMDQIHDIAASFVSDDAGVNERIQSIRDELFTAYGAQRLERLS